MDLLAELKACRAGAAETIAVMDVLIERFTRLAALGASVGPSQVAKTNGHHPPALPAPPVAAPAASVGTRERVLAAARHWIGAGALIQAVAVAGADSSVSAVYNMITSLVKDGSLRRRGKKAKYEYLAKTRGLKSMTPRGDLAALVLANAKDWVSFRDLYSLPGVNRKSIMTTIARLLEQKQIERRGSRMKYEYRVKKG